MTSDFLSKLMSAPARAKVLRTFVLNHDEPMAVAETAKRSGTPARIARREIAALERLDILRRTKKRVYVSKSKGVAKSVWVPAWQWNEDHEHAIALHSFVRAVSPAKYEAVMPKLRVSGRLTTVILSGAFMDDISRPVDILVAGERMNARRMDRAIRSLEPMVGREIRYASFTTPEFRYRLTIQDRLIRDKIGRAHV